MWKLFIFGLFRFCEDCEYLSSVNLGSRAPLSEVYDKTLIYLLNSIATFEYAAIGLIVHAKKRLIQDDDIFQTWLN